jgi:omega-amidase
MKNHPDPKNLNSFLMSNLGISIIQSAIHWEDKKANLDMFEKKIMGLPDKPEVIILPEMFSTGFSMHVELLAETMDGPTVEWMSKIAGIKNAIVTGSIIVREHSEEIPSYFNRLIWMLPTGNYGYYDKRHLFAYGKEDRHYSPGKKRLIASVNGWKVNLQICYDLRFPVWLRQSGITDTSSAPEYDLIIFVANWPSVRNHAWTTLLQARAIENQCYVVGVNRTGIDGNGLEYAGGSMIIGPFGDVIKSLSSEEEILSHTLDRNKLEEIRTKYPFLLDADKFFIQP